VSKVDRERKRGKKGGNLVTMTPKAAAENLATEGNDAAAEVMKPAQGSEGASATEVTPQEYKGAKKALRHALKAKVKAERVKIAEKLVEKVTQGDMKGTEIVLTLMEKAKEENAQKKKKRSGPSWAELLASEPEWDESMEENGGKKLAVVSGQ
jgi:fructose-specific phosphotransferase system component IIB